MRKGLITALLLAGASLATATAPGRRAPGPEALEAVLEPIRLKHSLPALGGAVVSGEGLQAIGAVGVRKSGTDVPVTRDDLWHLGSDTKAMTAAMIGRLVEQGRLTWDTTMGETFPESAGKSSSGIGNITLLELLSHRSGLPANTLWGLVPRKGTPREQRLFVVGTLARVRPSAAPGAAYLYSNLGYVAAGAMAEKAADASWEDLMRRLVFGPLGMTSAGFGGTGTPGRVDQPWPHGPDGKPAPKNGPDADNPPVMGPAGTVHCSLSDWGKFISDQLRGVRGEKALLKPETYERLRTPPLGGDYALGWLVADREWAGGAALTHSGSNTMNYATAWLAPGRDFAVLVVTNQGGETAARACDEASGALVGLWTERRSKGTT